MKICSNLLFTTLLLLSVKSSVIHERETEDVVVVVDGDGSPEVVYHSTTPSVGPASTFAEELIEQQFASTPPMYMDTSSTRFMGPMSTPIIDPGHATESVVYHHSSETPIVEVTTTPHVGYGEEHPESFVSTGTFEEHPQSDIYAAPTSLPHIEVEHTEGGRFYSTNSDFERSVTEPTPEWERTHVDVFVDDSEFGVPGTGRGRSFGHSPATLEEPPFGAEFGMSTQAPFDDVTVIEADSILVDPEITVYPSSTTARTMIDVDSLLPQALLQPSQPPPASFNSPSLMNYFSGQSFGYGAQIQLGGYPTYAAPVNPYTSLSSPVRPSFSSGGCGGSSCCCCCCCCEPEVVVQQVPYPVYIPKEVPQPPLVIEKTIIPVPLPPPPPAITTTQVMVRETVMEPVSTIVDPVIHDDTLITRTFGPVSRCSPRGRQMGHINQMLGEAFIGRSLPDEFRVMHISRSLGDDIQYHVGLNSNGAGCRSYVLSSPLHEQRWTADEGTTIDCPSSGTAVDPQCELGIF